MFFSQRNAGKYISGYLTAYLPNEKEWNKDFKIRKKS